jgi:hypothetical protein
VLAIFSEPDDIMTADAFAASVSRPWQRPLARARQVAPPVAQLDSRVDSTEGLGSGRRFSRGCRSWDDS